MGRRRPRTGHVAFAGGLIALLAMGAVIAGGRGSPPPAPAETLAHISAKNREAALAAAARMKADSKESARAADARVAAEPSAR